MIEFFNEHVRTAFHSLPIDEQLSWQKTAEEFARSGRVLKILSIDTSSKFLEIAVRIDEQLVNSPTAL